MSTTNFNNGIVKDMAFLKEILPEHYKISESTNLGSIHCKSESGLCEIWEAEKWDEIYSRIEIYFNERLKGIENIGEGRFHEDFVIKLPNYI